MARARKMLLSPDRLDRLAVVRRVSPAAAKRLSRSPEEYYSALQRGVYEGAALAGPATAGDLGTRDHVVGSWRAHNEWTDYADYLMRYVPDEPQWIALDFGCGPGRNLLRWSARFSRIDGADIAAANLENARRYLADIPAEKAPNLYLTSGSDLGAAPTATYDFVFSTIAMQHICMHSIRYAILKDIHRVLKPGGRLSIQMGYGSPSPDTVPWAADFADATGTNRACDVEISSPDQPAADLAMLGFQAFEYWLRPVGPGDSHPQWIYFTAVK